MPNEGSFEAALRRSDQIQRDLLVHPEDYTMLTVPPVACISATTLVRSRNVSACRILA